MKIAIVDSGLGLVSLLKMIVNFRLKHDIDLIFSKNFPLGNCSLSELEETAKDIEDRINKKNYDLVIIMCNTLSTIMKNKSYIKILDYNLKYLKDNKDAFPVGTKNTIDFLKKGHADEYLAKDIEEDNLKHIIFDINRWPVKKEYLLCCTHYKLVENIISMIKKEAKVTDLTSKVFEDLLFFPQSDQLKINYDGKENIIKKYLKF